MFTRSSISRIAIGCSLAILALHGLEMTVIRYQTVAASYFFLILSVLLAAVACFRQIQFADKNFRMHWTLLGVGLLFWLGASGLAAWGDLFAHISNEEASFADLVYFFYGVPLLLAISLPSHRHRSFLFLIIDAIQMILAGGLAYIKIFSVVPFAHQHFAPIPEALVAETYNYENVLLALTATIRLLSCPKKTEERGFFKILSGFLWVYAGLIAIYNSLVIAEPNAVGLRELLADAPFLLLAIFVADASVRANPETSATKQRRNSAAIFVETLSPLFFTLAILTLGASITGTHFRIGVGAMVVALVLYGIRAAIVQNHYIRLQMSLQEARDQLEESSRKDALTGVSNRRSFDQTLELEWKRALRTQQPLSLLLIDVDFFKNLNDKYGHRRGDECLVLIATALRAALPRAMDMLARYGGEEFVAVLPATGRSGAEAVAATMAKAVADCAIPNESSIGKCVSVSIGSATCPVVSLNISAALLLEAADQMLYKAKNNGRNRSEFILIS